MDNDFFLLRNIYRLKRQSPFFILSLGIIWTANRNSVFSSFPALEEDDRLRP